MISRAIVVFHQPVLDFNFLAIMVLFGSCSGAFGYLLCLLVQRIWGND